ncbi:MAG: helix-hairpin-helix domain-containing protein [Geminicoccaceae bacterium]
MAKANIHTASRDELVEAGVRAELADEILKLRRKGDIAGAEALEELQGVGPATVEQLRKALDFKAPERNGNGEHRKAPERAESDEHRKAPERAESNEHREPERRPNLERAADSARAAANAGTTAARSVLRVAHQSGQAAGEVQRDLVERSSEGLTEFNRVFADHVREHARQSLEAWTILARAVRWDEVIKAVDWQQVTELQTRYIRDSLDRSAQLTRRCLELGQAMMESAAAAQRKSDRAA